MSGIWENGEEALPGDLPGELMVVDGMPEGSNIRQLTGVPSAFAPDCAPEEMFEIAAKLYKASLDSRDDKDGQSLTFCNPTPED